MKDEQLTKMESSEQGDNEKTIEYHESDFKNYKIKHPDFSNVLKGRPFKLLAIFK